MVDAQAIKAEADCKRMAFLSAVAQAGAGRDAQAPARQARMRPSTRLRALLAGTPAPGRSTRPGRPGAVRIGGLLGHPA